MPRSYHEVCYLARPCSDTQCPPNRFAEPRSEHRSRDRRALPSSPVGEKMSEIEDVGVADRIHHICHRRVVGAARIAFVFAQLFTR